ncbi:hypothetical protein [Xanthomonas arboricola]|uniref:hypothetical protein n=1 Tax=Xanthomonas arboricola TaxID=56448 RepID=UPI0032E8881D
MADFDYLQYMQIRDLILEEEKAHEDANHNREIEMIVAVGERILAHCLKKVSAYPEIAEQEGGVNTLIRTFILSVKDWSYFTKDSHGSWLQHTACQEAEKVHYQPINQSSVPDLIINTEALRVELKSVALFTSKDRIPSDFFSKDLMHLHGDSDFNKFDYEGTSRKNRRAEMCLLIGDLDVIKKSSQLIDLIGNDFMLDRSRQHLRDWGVDGIRYEIRDCAYRSKTRSKDRRLCAILAFPGKKSGERT